MNLRWGLLVTALLYVLVVLFVMKTLLHDGFGLSTMLTLVPLAAIITVIAINSLSAYRIGLLVGAQAMVTYIIPIPLFDRLTVGMLAGLFLMSIYLLTYALTKKESEGVHRNFPSLMLAITAVVVITRLIIDRPGSARLGGVGGAGEAVAILLAMVIYFVGSKMCALPWDARKNYRAALLVCAIAYFPLGLEMVKRLIYGHEQLNLYTVPMFTLAAFILVYFIDKSAQSKLPKFKVLTFLITGLILLFSFISARRAAPFAAMASIFVMVYCYKQIRQFMAVALCALPLMFIFFLMQPEKIPQSMARTLSTVLPTSVSYDLRNRYSLGEMGFENEWRSRLARMAWEDIKRHPIFGRGFSYSFDDIVAAVSTVGQSRQDALYEGLALSGGYHDGILTMASFCGLPAAVAMVISMLSLLGLFISKVRRLPPSPQKMFAAALGATFVANFVQMATNGSGPSIYILCAQMAVMNGFLFLLSKSAVMEGAQPQPALPANAALTPARGPVMLRPLQQD